MTDGPQQCALPGCNEMVEQPDDGGPRRLYCSPAHRAAARKMRHAARMDAAPPVAAAADVTQPIAQAPDAEQTELPTTELPAPLGAVPRQEEPEPAPVPDREWSPAAAWTVAPPTLPSPRTVRTITSKRVKKLKPVRMAGDRQSSGTHIGRRAIASVAIASLVAGGASYFVSQNVIPTTPTPLPPQAANQPSMDADVWADKAQVVLASLSGQLDAVSQAEASWLALPAQRRAQEPAAVQALKDRKALLERQRAILMSQLEAFKALPERTTELTSAQAQLDAVERTLNESTTTAASPDYKEALRQLESQREIVRQQRDHAAQALTDLRNGVEQALSSPLPADKDETSPIVERVKAVVAGRPDPAEKDDDEEHKAADGQEAATTPRREDGDKERGDVGTTAPPDPERPNTPDILADGGRSQESNGDDKPESAGRSENPVQSVAGSLNRALGQGDTTNRDERANKRETRDDQGNEDRSNESAKNERNNNSGGGLGDVVRGVSGALLGGSDREKGSDDDGDDDGSARRGSSDKDSDERDDDRSSKKDRSSWGSDRDDDSDNDDRGSRRERDDDDDDDRGLIRGISDGLLGGDRDDDDDSDRKRPSGKAERQREKDRDDSEHDRDKSDSDDDDSDSHADEDSDHKRPSGKAERERKRDKDREESKHDSDKHDSDKDDDDKDDRDDDGDHEDSGKHKDRDSDDDSDKGDSDKGKDHGDSDDDGDDGGDDGGKSDNKKDKGDDDSGDSDSGGGDDD